MTGVNLPLSFVCRICCNSKSYLEARSENEKKHNILALRSIAIAIAICVSTYFLYHYAGPDGGLVSMYQITPAKPLITIRFGIWGVGE